MIRPSTMQVWATPGKRSFMWRGLALASILALVVTGFLLLQSAEETPFTTERMTFVTNVVPDTTNDEPIEVQATLYIPKAAKFPIPAVVITPSSSGVEQTREVYYARELTKVGAAALIIDSFSSRGLTDSLYDQSVLEQWDVENDAVAGLAELVADGRFIPDRIAIMGVSKGGTVAMDTALKIRRKWMGIDNIAFAAHIAISPDCTWITRNAQTTGAPILFMLAELDDQTPAKPCVAEALRIKNAGNERVETKVYKGAHHAWEELGWWPEHDPEAENYSKCRVWTEDDGKMYSAHTGELLPEDDWHSWAKESCMTQGVTCCGGSWSLKRQATDDIIAFLRRSGILDERPTS